MTGKGIPSLWIYEHLCFAVYYTEQKLTNSPVSPSLSLAGIFPNEQLMKHMDIFAALAVSALYVMDKTDIPSRE